MTTMPGDETPAAPRGARLPREERRAQLLESALEVFVGSGYHAAGMDEIAERAGVSKPVLYQHFPGKLDLYLALLDTACAQLLDSVRAALTSTDDNKARVVATMEAFLGFVGHHTGAYRLVFESDLREEPSVAERVRGVEQTMSRAIGTLVMDQAGLTRAEASLIAGGIVGMAQTAARTWLRDGSELPQHEAARLLADVVWRGIRTFPVVDDPESRP